MRTRSIMWSRSHGHRGELHAVGLLVHADPEPEVGRVDAELALDLDEVGGDQHQLGGAARGEVVLAEDLARHEGQQGAGLAAGDLAADGLHGRVGRGLLAVDELAEDRVHQG